MLPGPTERLRFRPFEPGDAGLVLEMFSDEQAARFFPDVNTLEKAGRWARFMRDRQLEHGHSLWVLEALDDGRPVGDCGILSQELDGEPLLEIGYHLLARERGRGFAGEAARHCLQLAFEATDAEEVGSLVHPDNRPSARVAERLHAHVRRVDWRGARYRLFFTRRGEHPSGRRPPG